MQPYFVMYFIYHRYRHVLLNDNQLIISRLCDLCVEMHEWQSRPLETITPLSALRWFLLVSS